MYIQFNCSKCEKPLKVRGENVGNKVRCPYCHGVVMVESPPPDTKVAKKDPQKDASPRDEPLSFEGVATQALSAQETPPPDESSAVPTQTHESTQGGDVGMLAAGGISLALTLIVCLGLWPLKATYLGALILERGTIPFVLVFFLSFSGVILFFKWRSLRRQKESMLFDLLPNEIDERIMSTNVESFVAHVRELPVSTSQSYLVNRVSRGLEHFRVLNDSSEVAARLESQSEIDGNTVDSSYRIVKVFIWAIPILGFIGTVMGISESVEEFSGGMDVAQNISALKNSLNVVTGGLAKAFDTTLVALVMSILVMFPMSSLHKAEDDLLNWVDEYCNENFLRRLYDGDRGETNTPELAKSDIARAVNQAMIAHHAELQTWTKKLEAIGGTLTDKLTDGLGQLDDQLQARHDKRLSTFNKTVAQMGVKQREVMQQLDAVQDGMSTLQERQVKQFETVAVSLDAQQRSVDENLSDVVGQLDTAFGGLRRGLESLSSVLETLGEKQVVIQQTVQAPARRGWGLFGKRNGD